MPVMLLEEFLARSLFRLEPPVLAIPALWWLEQVTHRREWREISYYPLVVETLALVAMLISALGPQWD